LDRRSCGGDLDIKRTLLTRVAAVRKPGTILSTNTSGIPLATIAQGFDDELGRHFLGTHFFNPPRYLHLVEVIRWAGTDPAVAEWGRELLRSPTWAKA